jgi:hypothetical protein
MIKKAKCPVCAEEFDLDEDLDIGDTTSCPACYADLKITRIQPVCLQEVDLAKDETDEEDAEDDF